MTTNIIPRGWKRAQAIVVNTAPSPYITEPGVIAVVTPYHKTELHAAHGLKFSSVADYEAWRKWWFEADADPRLNFTWQEPKAVTEAAPILKPGTNPFDKPKALANPFDQPKKPFNPFDAK